MTYPVCDNDCTNLKWHEAIVEYHGISFHISHAPETDLDDYFLAFDHDAQEAVYIKGWLIDHYDRIK